jgi:hypothetical protein
VSRGLEFSDCHMRGILVSPPSFALGSALSQGSGSCPAPLIEFSVNLDGGLWEAILDKQVFHFLSVVALKQYEPVLRSPAARAVSLEFGTQITEVDALGVNAFDDRSGFTPLSSLKADLDKLLLHADGSADTQILRKPTSGANFRHNFVQLLLFGCADIGSDSI